MVRAVTVDLNGTYANMPWVLCGSLRVSPLFALQKIEKHGRVWTALGVAQGVRQWEGHPRRPIFDSSTLAAGT